MTGLSAARQKYPQHRTNLVRRENVGVWPFLPFVSKLRNRAARTKVKLPARHVSKAEQPRLPLKIIAEVY